MLLGLIALMLAVIILLMMVFHFKNKTGTLKQKLISRKLVIYFILLTLDICK